MGVYHRTRKQWGARGNGGAKIGKVSEVVGHTEAGAPMSPNATVSQEEQRMRAIDAFHLSLGWSGGFGYSVAAMPSGRLHEGRGYRRSGAHTRGRNSTALAFVVPGHGDRVAMTEACITALQNWIGAGVKGGHIAEDPKISGHRDYSNKSCPGNKVYPQLELLRGGEIEPVPDPEPVPTPTPAPAPAPPPPAPAPAPAPSFSFRHQSTLRRGDRGAAVTEWQRALLRWDGNALPRFGADGDFGAETAAATGRFMQQAKLTSGRPSNPIVGPETRRRMVDVLNRKGGSPTFKFRHAQVISKGSGGSGAITEWQQALRRWNPRALPRFGADGDFGNETAEWTSRFMQQVGLIRSSTKNPVVGSRTRTAMERALNR